LNFALASGSADGGQWPIDAHLELWTPATRLQPISGCAATRLQPRNHSWATDTYLQNPYIPVFAAQHDFRRT
jgi:hypothetical protein